MRKPVIAAIAILLPAALVAAIALWPSQAKLPPRPAPTAPLAATIEIAPLAEALTFARTGTQSFAVTSYTNGIVSGVDLAPLLQPDEDALALHNRLGPDAIAAFVAAATTSISRPAAQLATPIDLADIHIAAATNYPEHANEADVTDGPFMFAKVARPTASRAPIPAGNGLLDYEVELCLVTMAPLAVTSSATGGLILCNDVTDRAALMRGVDIADIPSGKGFTDGKSGAGFMPVGDLFVVPRDLKAFIAPLELQLSFNGEERQRTRVTEWIWDLDRLLLESGKRAGVRWTWREGAAQLPLNASGIIPARTLIAAGTPAGTIFKDPGPAVFIRGSLDWLMSLARRSLITTIIERAIADERATGAYLQPGDVVTIRSDRLGTLENHIE